MTVTIGPTLFIHRPGVRPIWWLPAGPRAAKVARVVSGLAEPHIAYPVLALAGISGARQGRWRQAAVPCLMVAGGAAGRWRLSRELARAGSAWASTGPRTWWRAGCSRRRLHLTRSTLRPVNRNQSRGRRDTADRPTREAGNHMEEPVVSVLSGSPVAAAEPPEPPFFRDLNLDRVCAGVTAGREQYDLAPFLRTPLRDADAVQYRHEVLRDLEKQDTAGAVAGFAERMRAVRDSLAQARKLRYRYQKESWFLGAARGYCAAVTALADALGRAELASRGLTAFRDYLAGYAASPEFASLAGEAAEVARVPRRRHLLRQHQGSARHRDQVRGRGRLQRGRGGDVREVRPGGGQGLPGRLQELAGDGPRPGVDRRPGGPAVPRRVRRA